MGGCSAIKCSNSARDKVSLFRFPADETRRKKWVINCRRAKWNPGPGARLCSVHFEESQYEQHRKDKLKKLKPNAVPTLFNVPYPPVAFAPIQIKGKDLTKHETVLDRLSVDNIQETDAVSRIESDKEVSYMLNLDIIAEENNTIIKTEVEDTGYREDLTTANLVPDSIAESSSLSCSSSNTTRFLVVFFVDEKSLAVVPQSWVKNGLCSWPPLISPQNIKFCVLRCESPKSTWQKIGIRILEYSNSYVEASEKLKQAERILSLALSNSNIPGLDTSKQSKNCSSIEISLPQSSNTCPDTPSSTNAPDNRPTSSSPHLLESSMSTSLPKSLSNHLSQVIIQCSNLLDLPLSESSAVKISNEDFQKKVIQLLEEVRNELQEIRVMLKSYSKMAEKENSNEIYISNEENSNERCNSNEKNLNEKYNCNEENLNERYNSNEENLNESYNSNEENLNERYNSNEESSNETYCYNENNMEYVVKFKPYPCIPEFSFRVQELLNKGCISDHFHMFVRECAFALLNKNPKPSKRDYDHFCRTLIAKYPCIKDVVEEKKTSSKRKYSERQEPKVLDEFGVDKILDKRIVGDKVEYFIKWIGYPHSSNSWEPENNLNCPDIVKEFEENVQNKNESEKKRMHSDSDIYTYNTVPRNPGAYFKEMLSRSIRNARSYRKRQTKVKSLSHRILEMNKKADNEQNLEEIERRKGDLKEKENCDKEPLIIKI